MTSGRRWTRTTTAELIAKGALEIGDGYRAKNVEFADAGLPFARAQNIRQRFDFTNVDLFPENCLDRVGTKVSQPGDSVITTKGSVGRVAYVTASTPRFVYSPQLSFWRSLDSGELRPEFLRYWLQGREFLEQCAQVKGSTDMADYVNLRDQRRMVISLPPPIQQDRIVLILAAYDELIENNTRRIQILDEMTQAIYREWFVRFQYPGHEGVPLVHSDLGPIPVGWDVCTIAHLAAPQRYSVTSGPFGSKLGRKDYVASGVPVIRGANLAVGGGFRDAGFVYVLESKADELVSCIARPGDIVVTQRGTLGQVGLIPASARHGCYVLSQSQMKVTVNDEQASHHYLYAVLRSPEAAERIQNMAMSAGVPHINLTMLRNFPMVLPARPLQAQFEALVSPMLDLAESLHSSSESLRATRDLLLPRLISGEIDVSKLDIYSGDAAA
jgi:type I restriction enzyme S subunit